MIHVKHIASLSKVWLWDRPVKRFYSSAYVSCCCVWEQVAWESFNNHFVLLNLSWFPFYSTGLSHGLTSTLLSSAVLPLTWLFSVPSLSHAISMLVTSLSEVSRPPNISLPPCDHPTPYDLVLKTYITWPNCLSCITITDSPNNTKM